ncbi:multiprotein-bridging factor 1 [Vairimorpha apis BRL 01]|uniref:Multiprotein-bridging factor 1 n=1 Tax=Vairimorpha apis BRL 01 TaxID=1037528 RepID=T0MGQ1_9MICR|nr:multiprotein-bridging factor 1 [Vairimorpha apis BRL 01]
MGYDDKPIIIHTITTLEEITLQLVPKDVSQKIKDARAKLELDQKELAMKMDKKVSVIKEWEKGTAMYDKNLAKVFERVLKIKFDKC